MLQYIIKPSDKYSVESQVSEALAGGCRWIHLSSLLDGVNGASMKSITESVMPLCRDEEAFLVIDDNLDLVEELKVHGVVMHDNSRTTLIQTRERLGAHAVIGVYASSAEEIVALRGVDVDYVLVSVPLAPLTPVDIPAHYASIAQGMRDAGVAFHLVAMGDFAPDQMSALINAGCAGIATSMNVAAYGVLQEKIAQTINVLDTARFGNIE